MANALLPAVVLCITIGIASARPRQLTRRERLRPEDPDAPSARALVSHSDELELSSHGRRADNAASLDAQIAEVERARQQIVSQWPGSDPEGMLKAAFAVRPAADDGAALRDRLRRRHEEGQAFVFASLGSSVTAGHDNFGNQSWPYQLEEFLKPAFRNAGFDFEVRQRAFGGFGEMPFASGCLAERVGSGVDALNWEWDMFYDSDCEKKHLLWEAATLERRPVVFTIEDSSLKFDPTKAAAEHTPVGQGRRSKLKHNDDVEFSGGRVYRKPDWYLGDSFVSAEEVEQWKEDGPISNAAAHDRYGHEDDFLASASKEFLAGGLRLYPFHVSASSRFVRGNPWYEARERAFNINWHPGPLGHRLLASQLSHYFLMQLALALKEEKAGTPVEQLPGAPSGMPCGLVTRQCFTGVEPSSGQGLKPLRSSESKDSWVHALSTNEELAHTALGVSQTDLRRVYRGTKDDGELMIQLEAGGQTSSYAIFCTAPCGWNCKSDTGYMASNTQKWWDDKARPRVKASDVAFKVDGEEVPEERLLSLHGELFGPSGRYCPGNCKAKDICQPVAILSPGHHEVSLRVRPRSTNSPKLFVELQQIMLVGDVP